MRFGVGFPTHLDFLLLVVPHWHFPALAGYGVNFPWEFGLDIPTGFGCVGFPIEFDWILSVGSDRHFLALFGTGVSFPTDFGLDFLL